MDPVLNDRHGRDGYEKILKFSQILNNFKFTFLSETWLGALF